MANLSFIARGHSFKIKAPFQEGQKLGPAEARALNSLRMENIRNLVYKQICKLEGPEGLSAEALAQVQETVLRLDQEYSFGEAPRRDAPPKQSPMELECWIVAQEKAEEQGRLREGGASPEEVEELARELVKSPAIQSEAHRRMRAKVAVAEAELVDLF